MLAACGMNEHMASLSSDNGEAEGSCPEPAGSRATVCQPLCNSHFKEAFTSPSSLCWEQPGWAIMIMGSPGSLEIDRGAFYWGELIDFNWQAKTVIGKGQPQRRPMPRKGQGPPHLLDMGECRRTAQWQPANSGHSFSVCSSDMPLACRETALPSCLCPWVIMMKDTQNSDPLVSLCPQLPISPFLNPVLKIPFTLLQRKVKVEFFSR